MARLLITPNQNYQKYGENVKKLFVEAIEKRTPLKFEFTYTVDRVTYKKTVNVTIPYTKRNVENAHAMLINSEYWDRKEHPKDPRILRIESPKVMSSDLNLLNHIDKRGILFADVSKNHVKTQFVFNRGDVSEGILAAAITARFINKNKPITVAHIEDVMLVLDKYKKQGVTKISHIFHGPNKQYPGTKVGPDKVHCDISLKAADIEALLNPKVRKNDMSPYMGSSIILANKGNVAAKAKAVYENKKVDDIYVNSDGVGNQKGTKIDIKVKINKSEEYEDLNISVKAGDIKVFGNVSGNEFSTQQELWGRMGVPIENIEKEYNKLLSEGKESTALNMAYKFAAKDIQTKLISSNGGGFYEGFAKFIRYHATRDDPTVILMQLKNQRVAKAMEFANIGEKIANYTFQVSVSHTDNKHLQAMGLEDTRLPTLTIRSKQQGQEVMMGNEKSDFLSIRSTINPKDIQDCKYYRRNYIQKGKEMEQLFGIPDYESDPEAKDLVKSMVKSISKG
tara:strand:- start:46 stop:1569 length:1524 start_codon:yes stop_codon:yes gene_type:complete